MNAYPVTESIIICGGVPAWINSMKKTFRNIRFYEKSPNAQAMKNAHAIWFQANALSHKHYYKAINIARRLDIPVFYFDGTSASRCCIQLQDYLGKCS